MPRINDNSMPYDIEPCQVVLPGVPIIADSEQFSERDRLRIAGISTHSTSVERASNLADDLLRPVRLDLKRGRCRELLKLLERRPEFEAHPGVREQMYKYQRTGRSFTKRGRSIGSFKTHPLNVRAAVDSLISQGTVANREQAFAWLAGKGWSKYETAKKQYYLAARDDRFRAVLVRDSIWSPRRPKLKARNLVDCADQLRPESLVSRISPISQNKMMWVTFSAR